MKRKGKRSIPVMILWDRKQQQRFVEAVERLVSFTNDLEVLLAAKKRRSAAAHKAVASRDSAKIVNGVAEVIAEHGLVQEGGGR